MKFTICTRKTAHSDTVYTFEYPVGSNVVGLQVDRHRPQTVTLTREELQYLGQNPDYLLRLITILK